MLQETIETSTIEVIEGSFAVIRLPVDVEIPFKAFGVTRDSTETTAIVRDNQLRDFKFLESHDGLRILRINVSAPFMAPGFLAAVCTAVASKGVNVLVLSTFTRDYLLVSNEDLDPTLSALRSIGFPIAPVGASL